MIVRRNEFLDTRWVEASDRLVLGIEPRDAKRNMRIARPIEVVIEGPALTPRMMQTLIDEGRNLSDAMVRVPRHASCRHVIVYDIPPKDTVRIRLLDRWQHFVPRRLDIPLTPMADPTIPANLDVISTAERVRRPRLFPGAAYELSEQTTGLRGRVVRRDVDDERVFRPARWARVEATRNEEIVGTAHADHNGEFLLLLDSEAVREGQLVENLMVDVTAHAPRAAPVPPSALIARVDPLWDLPIEKLEDPGVTPDHIAEGIAPIAEYDGSATQTVEFQYGVLRSLGVAPFEIT